MAVKYKGNIKPTRLDIAFFFSDSRGRLSLQLRFAGRGRRPRRPVLPQSLGHIGKHIFNEDAIPRCGIADQHVRDRAHKVSVLDDRRARHECGQEGTTKFNRDLTVESINRLKLKQQVPFLKSFP